MGKGKILTEDEYARLIELIDLHNDLNITQIDHDEADEYCALLTKLQS